jgi:ABC-type multidrug transport system fused ATPase/permease subunit
MEKQRNKPSYSFGGNLCFLCKNMWSHSKGETLLCFLCAPFGVIGSFLGIYLSQAVVRAVTEGQGPQAVLTRIGWIGLALLLCRLMQQAMDSNTEPFMLCHDLYYHQMIMDRYLAADYAAMESPHGQNRMSKALENTGKDGGGARMVVEILLSLLENALGFFTYAGMILSLSPWILLAVSASTLGSFFLMRANSQWAYRNKDRWKGDDRRLDYISARSVDLSQAKDLRLYGMTGWFRSLFDQALAGRMGWHKKQEQVGFAADTFQNLLAFGREVVSYGGLIWAVFANGMGAADFVLYFGVIDGLSNWLFQLAKNLDKLYRFQLGFCEMREFLDQTCGDPGGRTDGLPAAPFSIEFRQVSFRYPGSEEDTLHNLSFFIPKGEKLAVVGLNGAGKTTLIKLICGFYQPTSGVILIDGADRGQFDRQAYYKLFSAVFQDIFLLPQSVAVNVSACPAGELDRDKVRQVLETAGLWEQVQALPQGMDTVLVRSVFDGALDLSGGQVQKLALARALYKDAPTLLLDEPTAALDPIAESEIYRQYNRMAGGRTAVFISHRLASTRFCDRIFFLENGRIAESGSHDQLMKKQGKYFELFEIQSHYYKKEAAEHDR